jgi:hypothetical protein
MDQPAKPLSPEAHRKQIAEALAMPTMQDAKRDSLHSMTRTEPDKAEKQRKGRMCEVYAFELDWEDHRKRRWQGRFTNKILTIRERKLFGSLRARQAGGVPLESLSPDTSSLIFMTCWMEISLQDPRPEWFRDIDSLSNINLIEAVFEEVAAHERTFHGDGEPPPSGA